MNKRFKKIREDFNLTQEEFANKLGIARSTVAGLEAGKPINNRTIKALCKTFKINEEWFKTGKGDMHIKIDDTSNYNEILAEWLVDSDPLTRETLMLLASLNDEDFKVVSRILKGLVQNK